MLKAMLRIRGTSSFRERLIVKRTAMAWISEDGGGPLEIEGASKLPSFAFTLGKPGSRQFSEEETRRAFPEGIDFTTARLAHVNFSGTTGSASEILIYRVLEDGTGIEVKFGEKNAARVRYPGRFDFNIRIVFGE